MSHALLAQTGHINGYFYDSADPLDENNLLTHSGLVYTKLAGADDFLPLLDASDARWRPFAPWWSEPVFKDDQGRVVSRGDLVRTVANQDGGAHVDPSLNKTYSNLIKKNSIAREVGIDKWTRPVQEPIRASLRQIGHEILRTLLKEYRKELGPQDGVLCRFIRAWEGGPRFEKTEPYNALIYRKD